ncbi:MAG TPA: hypothetical protein VHQ21_02970 [Rhodanobacteraceae bacterium]|nr:hypothetical protein [Rhodanobacteraceae bacterium]
MNAYSASLASGALRSVMPPVRDPIVERASQAFDGGALAATGTRDAGCPVATGVRAR